MADAGIAASAISSAPISAPELATAQNIFWPFNVSKPDLRAWTTGVEDQLNVNDDRIVVIEDEGVDFVGGHGKTVVDFGVFPGSDTASVEIEDQTGLTSASLIEAWLEATDTADHTADEHWADPLVISVTERIDGGFTITATSRSGTGSDDDLPYGKYTVAWNWKN